jgi:hypothetical protein
MTTLINKTGSAVQELIQTCQRSQQEFKRAADSITDSDVKKLLILYSQQRTRFAQELKAHLTQWLETDHDEVFDRDGDCESDPDILKWCLEKDTNSLRAYEKALTLVSPSKAQFLISAQYSLMQQVHKRMLTLASRQDLPPRQDTCTVRTAQLSMI